MGPLRQKLQNLTPRERGVLGVGVLGAGLIVIYAFVWQPWQDELNRLRAQVPLKQETLQWMRQQAALIEPLVNNPNKPKRASDKPLLTVVEQSAQQSKISPYIRRMAPGEDGQVKIWLTDADFDKWIVWLERLRRIGIEVYSASINRAKDNKVTIRVTLQG